MALDLTSYMLGRKSSGGGGSTGALVPVVVEELPTTGEEGKLYLVPRQTSETNNVFDEYIWVNNDFELIGTAEIDISGKQDKFQFSTMPNATSTNVGQIVQYIGTTTASYTNGYFYICVSDGQETPTYSWEYLPLNNAIVEVPLSINIHNSRESDISVNMASALKKYARYIQDGTIAFIRVRATDRTRIFMYMDNIISNRQYWAEVATFAKDYQTSYNNRNSYDTFWLETDGNEITRFGYVKETTIKYENNANKVTTISSSSTDTEYPSAKAVYDIVNNNKFDVTSISGYDATTTQILKNVNGTLTWVEEIQQVINGEVSDGGEVGGEENNEGGNEPNPDNNEEQNE